MTQLHALSRPTFLALGEQSHQRNQPLDVKAVHNTQNSPVSRTLDAYGIDDNRKMLSQRNTEKYHILVKRDNSGTPDLTHGAYISKQGEDDYGVFKWLEPKRLIKYQAPDVAVIKFTSKDQLAQLGETYAENPLPRFFTQVLNGEVCLDTDLYNRNERLVQFVSPIDSTQHGYLIGPNTPYIDEKLLDVYVDEPEILKNNKHGVILCTFATHPNLQSSFLGINHEAQVTVLDASPVTPQKSFGEETQIKSLTSILDLKKEHLPQLEKLKDEMMQHLHDVYAVNEHDHVKMFFHFPTAEVTATLHLHTWVNRANHPINEERSYELDTIIAHLESGKAISDLVLERNEGAIRVLDLDPVNKIKNLPREGMRENGLRLPL